ncbi:MAG TPA: DNA repair protein RecO [Flavipsychrobacter sp.]|nr:DNA repair protein RecO [Flavipsychrobacter sp.]
MLQTTKGIILRTVKYGETSLIVTVFTEHHGVQAYLAQGVRKSKKNSTGLLQPSLLLELETDYKPHKNLQRLRGFHPAFIYQSIQENVVKNSIAIFCAEVLLRLLPENAPMQELFDFSFRFFQLLDHADTMLAGNYPLFFLLKTGEIMGYKLKGEYSENTPFINIEEGRFTEKETLLAPLNSDDTRQLSDLVHADETDFLLQRLSAITRNHLTDWYLEFIRMHSQHLGQIKSLSVIRTILH